MTEHLLAEPVFRRLFEASPHPYLVLSPDAAFTIVAVNERYLAATGTRRDDLLGRSLFEAFPDNPSDPSSSAVSDLRVSLDRVIRSRAQDVMGVQKYDIPRRDGQAGFEVKYWSPVNTPVFAEDGRLAFLIHHVEDVTDFILSREHAARASSARVEKVEARAARMEAEVRHRALDVKQANRELKAAMEERERREAELAALNDRLRDLDRAKTEFFSNISHEFRTPLTLLLGPLEDLLARADGTAPADRTLLEIAHRNGLRLLTLVNTLLDFSVIEAGRARPQVEPTDLPRLTSELASTFRSACDHAGLALAVDCPSLAEPADVDRGMWEKIVLNLLSNAFKFTLAGRIDVRLRDVGAGRGADGERHRHRHSVAGRASRLRALSPCRRRERPVFRRLGHRARAGRRTGAPARGDDPRRERGRPRQHVHRAPATPRGGPARRRAG